MTWACDGYVTWTCDSYVSTTILHYKTLVFVSLYVPHNFKLICLFQKTTNKNNFTTLKDNKLKDKIDGQQIICFEK